MKYLWNTLSIIIHHFFSKAFYKVNQAKNEQMTKQVDDANQVDSFLWSLNLYIVFL